MLGQKDFELRTNMKYERAIYVKTVAFYFQGKIVGTCEIENGFQRVAQSSFEKSDFWSTHLGFPTPAELDAYIEKKLNSVNAEPRKPKNKKTRLRVSFFVGRMLNIRFAKHLVENMKDRDRAPEADFLSSCLEAPKQMHGLHHYDEIVCGFEDSMFAPLSLSGKFSWITYNAYVCVHTFADYTHIKMHNDLLFMVKFVGAKKCGHLQFPCKFILCHGAL